MSDLNITALMMTASTADQKAKEAKAKLIADILANIRDTLNNLLASSGNLTL